MAARTDITILHEIVRVIETREKVPDRVRIRTKQYQITYLDDHRARLEEAIRRRDRDRLNMLFGQLQGKVRYQALKQRPKSSRVATKAPSKSVKRRAAAR